MTVPVFDTASDLTLWSLAIGWARRTPEAIAVVSQPDPSNPSHIETWTWRELVDNTGLLRERLAARGVGPGTSVLMALPNSPLALALWLAVPANAAMIQVIDVDSGQVTIDRALSATQPILAVIDDSLTDTVRRAVARGMARSDVVIPSSTDTRSITTGADGLGAASAEPADAAPGMVAGLLPTSGTSGMPKWVMLTHHNYVMGAERMVRNSGFTAADRHYLCSPFFHINAQVYICASAFVTGGSIAIVPRFSAGAYFDSALRLGATVASMVAPPMRMALRRAVEQGKDLTGLRLRLIQYGMAMGQTDWEYWDRFVPGIRMRQIYGQTESVSGVLGGAPWEDDDRRTIGRPFLGVDGVRVVDESGRDLEDGLPGELWIRGVPGRTIMLGYLDDPKATASTIVDGTWLRTGDIVIREPSGRFAFRGRRMHIIRKGGENLSTYALELDYQSCPMIRDVAVTSAPDATLDALVVAHVIPGESFQKTEFLTWCRENLGKRFVPDQVRTHLTFPRTGSGRVVVGELDSNQHRS